MKNNFKIIMPVKHVSLDRVQSLDTSFPISFFVFFFVLFDLFKK